MPANDSGMMGDQRVGRFGEPAAASEADRVIEVEQFDLLRFEPTEIQVDLGETMRFDVTNVGSHDHEFVIGDESYQAAHGDDMSDDGHGAMQAMPNGVLVAPGATESFAWTFTEPGTFEFACHLPGHYEGGMKGRIIVAG
ncbi:MAG: plastocyanin/azurin family copper-binding protein [Planctomycetales bacterium]